MVRDTSMRSRCAAGSGDGSLMIGTLPRDRRTAQR
jgi:hypothetical protein